MPAKRSESVTLNSIVLGELKANLAASGGDFSDIYFESLNHQFAIIRHARKSSQKISLKLVRSSVLDAADSVTISIIRRSRRRNGENITTNNVQVRTEGEKFSEFLMNIFNRYKKINAITFSNYTNSAQPALFKRVSECFSRALEQSGPVEVTELDFTFLSEEEIEIIPSFIALVDGPQSTLRKLHLPSLQFSEAMMDSLSQNILHSMALCRNLEALAFATFVGEVRFDLLTNCLKQLKNLKKLTLDDFDNWANQDTFTSSWFAETFNEDVLSLEKLRLKTPAPWLYSLGHPDAGPVLIWPPPSPDYVPPVHISATNFTARLKSIMASEDLFKVVCEDSSDDFYLKCQYMAIAEQLSETGTLIAGCSFDDSYKAWEGGQRYSALKIFLNIARESRGTLKLICRESGKETLKELVRTMPATLKIDYEDVANDDLITIIEETPSRWLLKDSSAMVVFKFVAGPFIESFLTTIEVKDLISELLQRVDREENRLAYLATLED